MAGSERAVVFLGSCPRCDTEPERWSSNSEFECEGCGVTLMTNLRHDDDGAEHWSFDYAFEDDAGTGGTTKP